MIKFEPKYVHCFWNDELEGKKGFVADTMGVLKDTVESNDKDWFGEIWKNPNNSQISYPFGVEDEDGVKTCYRFCYYDPNFKSEDKAFWIVFDERFKCIEIFKYDVQGKTVFFTGTKEECEKWINDNKYAERVLKAYRLGKPIIYKEKGVKNDPWKRTEESPSSWDFNHYEYDVIYSKELVPFENTQELIEAWEKKCPANKDRPNGTMPLIWIKEKEDEYVHLISDFYKTTIGTSSKIISFESLFEEYTFADGSVCGKKEE